MDSNVEFIAADNPHANRLTVHILAAVAEHERAAISESTCEHVGQALRFCLSDLVIMKRP